MRIINNPNPITENLEICPECKCEFAYTKGDIKSRSWNNGVLGPGYSSYTEKWINCPNCGKSLKSND